MTPHAQLPIEEVLRTHRDELMVHPAVVGIAIGEHDSEPAVVVYLRNMADPAFHNLPTVLDGYPVVFEEVGEVRAL